MTGGKDQATVVAEVVAAPEFRFLCRLRRKSVTGSLDDLEGEAVLVGKVQRKIGRQDKELLVDFPGMSLLDRQQRRDLIREQGKTTRATLKCSSVGPRR